MRDKGFDQLPVSTPTGSRLVGLVTLGNLLSYLSSGRADADSPVKDVMFDFTALEKTVDDPAALGQAAARKSSISSASGRPTADDLKPRKRPFVEITIDTQLSALQRFFEWNSAAVVTERRVDGGLKAVAVVTKVDLLTWLVRTKNNTNGQATEKKAGLVESLKKLTAT